MFELKNGRINEKNKYKILYKIPTWLLILYCIIYVLLYFLFRSILPDLSDTRLYENGFIKIINNSCHYRTTRILFKISKIIVFISIFWKLIFWKMIDDRKFKKKDILVIVVLCIFLNILNFWVRNFIHGIEYYYQYVFIING